MHYIIFGKFQPQNKPLNSKIKVFLWNRSALISLFAQKYLHHKTKTNVYNQDVFFLEKTKVYKLTSEQYEEDGDVIMIDFEKIQNLKYPETEIHNTSLNAYFEKLDDNNIVIQLINL
jgi:hypothetical protein